MQIFPVGKTWDFMTRRWLFMGISAALVLASIVLMFVPGPKLGPDFVGGTEVELAFQKPVTADQIREAVVQGGLSTPDVIPVEDPKNPHRFLIRIQEVSTLTDATVSALNQALCFGEQKADAACRFRADDIKVSLGGDKITLRLEQTPDLAELRGILDAIPGLKMRSGDNNPSLQSAQENRVEVLLEGKGDQLVKALRTSLGEDVVPEVALRTEWIGPKAGAQLRNSAIKSIIIALVLIMVYIALRFDLRFAPGAILSLMHDAVVTIGVLIVLGKELNLTVIAAILTIIGFSINDTVVVYDRVRENLGRMRGASMFHLVNVSLSEMMSRTILTSGVTMLALVCFFVWGTGTLKDFALTLVIGMVLGVYSSIYVALPLTEYLDRKFFAHMKKPVKTKAIATT
jgi:preprotein translocase subunit SecF